MNPQLRVAGKYFRREHGEGRGRKKMVYKCLKIVGEVPVIKEFDQDDVSVTRRTAGTRAQRSRK